jgi:hypothetical protein
MERIQLRDECRLRDLNPKAMRMRTRNNFTLRNFII